MIPVARMGDTFTCSDVIAGGSGNVFINNLPAAVLGSPTAGHGPPPCFWPPTVIASGSGSVFVNNLPIAKLGDPMVKHCCGPSCHTGVINSGSGDVFAG